MSIVPHMYYDRKVKTRRYNQYLRDALDPFDISDRCFIDNYRLPKHLAIRLINEIECFVDDVHNSLRIPIHLEVLACLNFYASGSHQRRVGLDAFAVMSQSRISLCIARISKIIGTKLSHNYIKFPSTLAAANLKKEEFYTKYGVPGIVGLLDCTHIAIADVKKQIEYFYVESLFYRKGFHSINTQAICDVDQRIMTINARYPGSTHDSHIWGGSRIMPIIRQINLEDNRTWLLGDSGYGLKPYMMVPFRNPSDHQLQYNRMHTVIRSGIERCFGILKGRFRCLKASSGYLHYTHEKAANIIYSCAVLHNLLINNNYPIDADIDIEEEIVPNLDIDEDGDISGEQNRLYLSNLIQETGLNF